MIIYKFKNGESLDKESAEAFLQEDNKCCVTCENGNLSRYDEICLKCLGGENNYKDSEYTIIDTDNMEDNKNENTNIDNIT